MPNSSSTFDDLELSSDFTQKIADSIVEIKNDKKVRQDFMTYAMRMKDIRNDAFTEGEAKGEARGEARGKFTTTMTLLKNLMHNNHCSVDEAMSALGIVIEDRQHYKDLLAKGL